MSSAQLVDLDGAECKVISVNTVVVYKNLHLFIVQKKEKESAIQSDILQQQHKVSLLSGLNRRPLSLL